MKPLNGILSLVLITTFSGCVLFFKNEPPVYSFDLVCGMKVSEADAYTYKYKKHLYYFNNIDCKKSFEMNPQKFIDNKCTPTQ